MSIRVPRGGRRSKAIQDWAGLNAWATVKDETEAGILEALNAAKRQLNGLTPSSAGVPSLVAHAGTHLPGGSDPINTAAPTTITPDAVTDIGVINALSNAGHVHGIATDVPVNLGTANAEGSGNAFARSTHVHRNPDRLQDLSNTDQLIFSSDGTNLTLALSRASSDLLLNDQAGVTLSRWYDSTVSERGLHVNGHALVGRGSASFGTTPGGGTVLNVAENLSDGLYGAILGARALLNTDVTGTGAGDLNTGVYQLQLANGFDASGGDPVSALQVTVGGSSATALTGVPTTVRGLQVTINPSIPAAGTPWPDVMGIDITAVSVAGTAAGRAYGIKVAGIAGTLTWAASLAGMTQIATTSRLGFGRAQTAQPTNSFRARTSLGSNIVLELNSADEWEWSTTAFFPVTNGGGGIGQNGNGIADLWLKDTAAAFETRIIATNTGISADNTLTLDLGNASRTLTLSASVALNQNLLTTSNVQFNTVRIDGDLDHNGTNIGFFGVAPVARAAAYTPTNVTPDRSYDANATTVDELADVLGTLIADLQAYGLLQ